MSICRIFYDLPIQSYLIHSLPEKYFSVFFLYLSKSESTGKYRTALHFCILTAFMILICWKDNNLNRLRVWKIIILEFHIKILRLVVRCNLFYNFKEFPKTWSIAEYWMLTLPLTRSCWVRERKEARPQLLLSSLNSVFDQQLGSSLCYFR